MSRYQVNWTALASLALASQFAIAQQVAPAPAAVNTFQNNPTPASAIAVGQSCTPFVSRRFDLSGPPK